MKVDNQVHIGILYTIFLKIASTLEIDSQEGLAAFVNSSRTLGGVGFRLSDTDRGLEFRSRHGYVIVFLCYAVLCR
jgi:hypothetical protein